MYYAHSKEKSRSWRRKAGFWKRFSGMNGGFSGGQAQFSSKIVGRELVYNDELTAQSGRLTQR